MWSVELKRDLKRLRPQQRHAIARILEAESQGISRTRLLKTSYSCSHCGWYCQASLGNGDQRKAILALHEAEHIRDSNGEPPEEWHFIASPATYYRWMEDELFSDCLSRASEELTTNALNQAVHILKTGAPAAAQTLLNLAQNAGSENVRKGAAAALLDRADLTTALKASQPTASDPYLEHLRRLRGEDDELPQPPRDRRLAEEEQGESDG